MPALEELNRLTHRDTPTICNSLEHVYPEHRALGFSTGPLVSLAASMPPVILKTLMPRRVSGAFRGEVNAHVHCGLGVAGCVTNGSMRDLPDLPDSAADFQLLADRVGPSHADAHLIDYCGDVKVENMSVGNGDIIHMDQHGALVIPAHALTQIPAAIELISRDENIINAAIVSAGEIH